MRLGILFSSYFWGVLLILLGISAILKSLNVNIPIFRTFIALVFIYIGVSLLLGHNFYMDIDDNFTIFSENNYSVNTLEDREINVLFGKGILDLSNLEIDEDKIEENKEMKIVLNNIFASTDIKLSRQIPIRINASSVFGSASLPDGSKVSFGDHNFNSSEQENLYIDLDVNTVFGSVDVFYVD